MNDCTRALRGMLKSRKDLKKALKISIQQAGFPDIKDLHGYYRFLDGLLSEVPVRRDMGPFTDKFHYLIAHSPGNILKKDRSFRNWLVQFSRSHGVYLDTAASARKLDSFIEDPAYHIQEYDAGASGWRTFNQFFTRHVKPGKRPIAEICNPRIVVSPADSVYKGYWPLDENALLIAKGTSWSVRELLADSPYRERFANGVFTHSYLDTTDYHRFHTPVAGIIREARTIPGDVIVNTIKKEDGTFETLSDVGFQFKQTRGLVIIESMLGLVAILPIGMGHVSSVLLTAETGAELYKGQEFGYFAYGGSDMVMVFETGKVEFIAQPGTHYKQGEQIARAVF